MKQPTKQNKRIRKGDTVLVIAGNSKGETGTVLSRTDKYAIVQGVNVRKKHVKRTQENPQGGIVEMERPIHISNLRYCDQEETPVKLRAKIDSNGEKTIYYRAGDKEVSLRSGKKAKSQ